MVISHTCVIKWDPSITKFSEEQCTPFRCNFTICLKVAVYGWYMRQKNLNKEMYSCANWTCVYICNTKSKYFFSLQMPCGSKHLPQFYSWWKCTTVNLWSFPLYWILRSNLPVQCEVLSGTVRTGKYSSKSDRLNVHCCVPTAVMIHICSPTCPASIPIASHAEPLNLGSCILW